MASRRRTSSRRRTTRKSTRGRVQFDGRRRAVMVPVPAAVARAAERAFVLRDQYGFQGGTSTGWKRARQLRDSAEISVMDLRYMRAWFARHKYTSLPSYLQWKRAGSPVNDPYWHRKRGIIAWLIWGGDPGHNWVESVKMRRMLG